MKKAQRSQTLIIEGELPSENEIIAAQMPKFKVGTRWVSKYSEWKQYRTTDIVLAIRMQRIVPVEHYPVTIDYVFYTKDERKDPDNILAGASKFILDALKEAGIIRNDGWSELVDGVGFFGSNRFFCDAKERPRIEVILVEHAPPLKDDSLNIGGSGTNA